MTFQQKLTTITEKNNSLLCIGLDPELEKLPEGLKKDAQSIFVFNKAIIDATHDLVNAYKPNIAFYEACGIEGLHGLKQTIEYLQEYFPEIPIVLDAKRADIGNTAKMYAKAAFEYWNVDAVTVHANLGLDSLIPFFEYKNKLTIILIKTSNPDSGMFQDLEVDDEPYYLKVAQTIQGWEYDTIGLFVGATYPQQLREVRDLFPDRVFLSAGIGAQDANIEEAVKAGLDENKKNIMYNASRSIIYASKNEADFTQKAREKAEALRDQINTYRK